MAFKSVLDEWNESRQLREPMPGGERWGSLEHELGGNMKPNQPRWERWENFMARKRGEPELEP